MAGTPARAHTKAAKITAMVAVRGLPASGMKSFFPASSRRLAQTIYFSHKFVKLIPNVNLITVQSHIFMHINQYIKSNKKSVCKNQ